MIKLKSSIRVSVTDFDAYRRILQDRRSYLT